ncbi:4458_t:CDS:2 [Ambispora gerdemannii]|uniref:4458_t:CDS:1 n=1 Tax=Ambispora gerdemannii TaxID=144530 RepID=A0A9N9G648_9GLOM|nr:4458_t:CDS:2 [Ambispora gerdemannii]
MTRQQVLFKVGGLGTRIVTDGVNSYLINTQPFQYKGDRYFGNNDFSVNLNNSRPPIREGRSVYLGIEEKQLDERFTNFPIRYIELECASNGEADELHGELENKRGELTIRNVEIDTPEFTIQAAQPIAPGSDVFTLEVKGTLLINGQAVKFVNIRSNSPFLQPQQKIVIRGVKFGSAKAKIKLATSGVNHFDILGHFDNIEPIASSDSPATAADIFRQALMANDNQLIAILTQ